ncbi:MAG: ATP-binding protein [Candidatus Margulisbacteria bacterium]|nr:ATP-binding protein [Candidatus Margulisiibacteriota bacterium]
MITTIQVLTIIITLGIGLFVLLQRKETVNRLFFAISLSISGWIASIVLFYATGNVCFSLSVYLSGTFFALFFLIFSFYFPRPFIRNKKNLIWFCIPALIIIIIISSNTRFITKLSFINGVLKINFGPLFYLFFAYFLIYCAFGIWNIIRRYNVLTKPNQTRVVVFIAGFILSIFSVILINVILPLLDITGFVNYGPLSILILVSSAAFAIVKQEMFEIHISISKTVAYMIIFCSLILSLLIVHTIIHFNYFMHMVFEVLLITFWVLTIPRFREWLQTPTTAKWIVNKYRPEEHLQRLFLALKKVDSVEKFIYVLEKYLKESIGLSNLESFLLQQDNNDSTWSFVSCATSVKYPVSKPFVEKLLKIFNSNKDIKTVGEELRNIIIETGIEPKNFLLPLHTEKRIVGFINCGKKLSEDAYNSKDTHILSMISEISCIILELLQPYENIREIFNKNQKIIYDNQRQLLETAELERMNNFIQEYNHEIRTPLTLIIGKAEEILSDKPNAKTLTSLTSIILTQAGRIQEIIDAAASMTILTKTDKLYPVDINEQICLALEHYPVSGIAIQKNLKASEKIFAVKNQLEVILINIIKNACESMDNKGNLVVETRDKTINNERFVEIIIRDTGRGIPEADLLKVYTPFYSTKATEGRGLGLSIVLRLVEHFQGNIEIKSDLDKGTSVYITFPAAK